MLYSRRDRHSDCNLTTTLRYRRKIMYRSDGIKVPSWSYAIKLWIRLRQTEMQSVNEGDQRQLPRSCVVFNCSACCSWCVAMQLHNYRSELTVMGHFVDVFRSHRISTDVHFAGRWFPLHYAHCGYVHGDVVRSLLCAVLFLAGSDMFMIYTSGHERFPNRLSTPPTSAVLKRMLLQLACNNLEKPAIC